MRGQAVALSSVFRCRPLDVASEQDNGIAFDNSEQGTYARQGNTLTFTRSGGGGEGFPYLLGPGTVSADDSTVTLLYGDEGPGSDQISATFRR
jgi:hypothetical protein